MVTEEYLRRIKINSRILVDLSTLRNIQKNHLMTIPFENLDIHINKHLITDLSALYEKIVAKNRGGICYELNWLLYSLLVRLGFCVRVVGAKVEKYGTFYDHLLLIVTLNKLEYLVDVGFGNNFLEPLLFETNITQNDKKGLFKIIKKENHCYELMKYSKEIDDYSIEYIFRNKEKSIGEFQDRMSYYVHNNHSIFKKNLICSLEKLTGRISLKQDKLIITDNGSRKVKNITSMDKFIEVLNDTFEITLDLEQKKALEEWF